MSLWMKLKLKLWISRHQWPSPLFFFGFSDEASDVDQNFIGVDRNFIGTISGTVSVRYRYVSVRYRYDIALRSERADLRSAPLWA